MELWREILAASLAGSPMGSLRAQGMCMEGHVALALILQGQGTASLRCLPSSSPPPLELPSPSSFLFRMSGSLFQADCLTGV